VTNIDDNCASDYQLRKKPSFMSDKNSDTDKIDFSKLAIENPIMDKNLMLICSTSQNLVFIHNWDYENDVLIKTYGLVSPQYALTEYLSAITVNTKGDILLLDLENSMTVNLSEATKDYWNKLQLAKAAQLLGTNEFPNNPKTPLSKVSDTPVDEVSEKEVVTSSVFNLKTPASRVAYSVKRG